MKIYTIFIILILCSAVMAQSNKIEYTTYYFTDSGDNTVFTSAFSLAKKILSRTYLLLDIELDNVTVPPVDALTGASRPQRKNSEPFEKTRGQVILGFEQGFTSTTTLALNLYRSQEVDYLSNSVIATLSQDLFQQNTTITLRGQYNDDRVGEITESGRVVNQSKRVFTGAVNLTQILSKTAVLNLSYDGVYMDGFLSDPYRQVKVFDENNVSQNLDEVHPDTRLRQAGTARISQYILPVDASLIGSYRYYFDDWEVRSHTLELKLNKYIFSNIVFGATYRYYTQSEAEFYQERYAGDSFLGDALKTDDYKLKSFVSNNYGLSLRFLLRGLGKSNPDLDFLQDSSIQVSFFRYVNDLDFSANIVQGSLVFSI